MNPAADMTALLNGLDGLWLPAVDALIKVTLVLGIASAAALVLGRASAAMRHLVWTLALTSALVLPVLSVALPRWQLPIVLTTTPPAPTPRQPAADTDRPCPAMRGHLSLDGRLRHHILSAPAAVLRRRVTPRISLTMAPVTIGRRVFSPSSVDLWSAIAVSGCRAERCVSSTRPG